MIKFEKDEVIKYFDTAEDAVKWLEQEYEEGGQYEELLEDIAEPFAWWVNNNWTAYDILTDPEEFSYNELRTQWLEELAFDIENNYITYFKKVEDKE